MGKLERLQAELFHPNIKVRKRAVEKLEKGTSVPLRLIRRGTPLFIGLRLEE